MLKYSRLFSAFLITVSSTIFAEDAPNAYNPYPNAPATAQNISNLTNYFQNLGRYFGYDVTEYCQTGGPCNTNSTQYINRLFNPDQTYLAQLNLYNSYLGALVGGGQPNTPNYNPIVPNNLPNFSVLNSLAGQTYLTGQETFISSLIDQKKYQVDPISQSILNILTTPNASYCTTTQNSAVGLNPDCPYLYRELVMANVIGPLPGTDTVFTASYNQSLVPQLNGDTLFSPLLYSSTNNEQANNQNSNQNQTGLVAQSQIQQAENFIRYATAAVNPLLLPPRSVYDHLVMTANGGPNTSKEESAQARYILINYITLLRTYAAQTSVGISNLYSILSRRMPQKIAGGNENSTTSEALNEYTMATWRLYNPAAKSDSANAQWLNKINSGSNATVQKEIAILLSEINYQLYLSRQQQERILLTESMLLLQNSIKNRPDGTELNASSNNPTEGS